MSARPPEHDWFEKAEQDLEMAYRAMSAGIPLPAMACYHCQQCAEKYLKGFLVSRSVEFRPVHDLDSFPIDLSHDESAFGNDRSH